MPLTYTVSLPEVAQRSLKRSFVELPRPKEDLQPGQVLRVMKPVVTLGNFCYYQGDILELVERTQEAPYGYQSSLGNWVVRCPHQVSVWSNIEAAVAEGELTVTHRLFFSRD
jgi:hypothetical protein